MKALKTLTIGGVLSAAMAASVPAIADDRNSNQRFSLNVGRISVVSNLDDRHDRHDRNERRSNFRNDHRDRGDSRYRNNGPVTVRLNYDANGSGTVSLKRLLRKQHGINSDEWRIRSVNVRNRSRGHAYANLSVGSRSTGAINLRRGTTSIQAPSNRSDGQWVLNFRNAKVRDVAVILEPRGQRQDQRVGKYRPLERDNNNASRSIKSGGVAFSGNRR